MNATLKTGRPSHLMNVAPHIPPHAEPLPPGDRGAAVAPRDVPLNEVRRAQPWLGTLVEIGARGREAARAVSAAFTVVAKVHRLMSYHDPASDVSRVNRDAAIRPVTIHPWTRTVMSAAAEFAAASDGLFDITVAPTLARLGYLPRHGDFPRASGQGDWRMVELLADGRVRLARRLRIDLGGIAKGFAVDRAITTLQSFDVDAGFVNAGGDLRRFGATHEPLLLRHPRRPTVLVAAGRLGNRAAATSAGYFATRRYRGRWVTPYIHPRTRTALAPGDSVTVVADDCMTADALTKVVLLNPTAAQAVLARYGAHALILVRAEDTATSALTCSGSTEVEHG